MTMSPRLELRQSQALVMTPRLQQALRMLRMSNLELAEHVAGIIESNPLLSAAPSSGGLTDLPRSRGVPASEGVSAVDLAAAHVTLAAHVAGQVRLARAAPAARAAALAIVAELDEDGYLRTPLAELAERHGPADWEAGLQLVQACEPAGVGARSLPECLRLQLEDRGLLDAPMAALIDGLALLTAGRGAELAARCGTDAAGLAAMLQVLRSLNPKPGAGWEVERAAPVVPDVFVLRGSMGWIVEVNTETLPRVLVNNRYAAQIAARDEAARVYIAECRGQASWLVRSLEQRARTILSVAGAIVTHQEHFFARGIAGLRPLSQRALAEKIGLHESTVSRVTADKFLACDRGVFPLRHFFSTALATSGGGAVAAAAVQDRIRTLIGGEGPARPLSDDGIVAALRGEGIDIARRTVAKYRDGMGIPSSMARRRLAASGLAREPVAASAGPTARAPAEGPAPGDRAVDRGGG